MKLSAPDTLKFKKMKMRLKLPHWQAVGVLESIWMFTQRNSPQGDIGRHSNEDIAAAIEWDDDPDKLMAVLTECGFIDACEESRLVVHDWKDHAPNWLLGNLAKYKKTIKIGVSAEQRFEQSATKRAKQATEQAAMDLPY